MNIFKKSKLSYAVYQRFAPRFNVFGSDKTAAITEGYKKNSTVYSCISYMAGKAGRLNLKVKRNGKEVENELSKLLKKDFLEEAIGYLKSTGDLFIYAPKKETGNNKGKVISGEQIYIMPSNLVSIKLDKEGEVRGYKLLETDFDKENVLHIKYFNPASDQPSPYGWSPISGGRYVINRDTKNMEASSRAYDNMGATGLLTSDSKFEDQMITKEQADQIEGKLKKKYSGVNNFGKWIVTSAQMKWQQLGLSPADLKLIEDRKMGIREICNVFHLNSAIFNDPNNKSYNNMSEARIAAWTDAIIPDIEKIVTALNNWLTPAYGGDFEIYVDYSSIEELQKNKKELVSWLKDAYWIKVKRKQEIMGEEPDEDMDMYLIPTGLMPLNFLDEKSIEKFYKTQKFNEYGIYKD